MGRNVTGAKICGW
uniref:Uncharacterized protein n=1 Tax=Anguilla anguilla TaxID=7936 RepID=A0A0E9XQ22_ANGAN